MNGGARALRTSAVGSLVSMLIRSEYVDSVFGLVLKFRLASHRLREFQCFQDPGTYARDKRQNDARVQQGKAAFL